LFNTLEYSIVKFLKKWGKIFKYESGLTWIALGLAEWIPPLLNDDLYNNNNNNNKYVLLDINSTSTSNKQKSLPKKQLSFPEIYERIVLVLLHSPEPEDDTFLNIDFFDNPNNYTDHNNLLKTTTNATTDFINSLTTLPIKGGSIEERISFFSYLANTTLPELTNHLKQENIFFDTNNFSNNNNDWIIWWLKWYGAKLFNKFDRARIWDCILGWRPSCSLLNNNIIIKNKNNLSNSTSISCSSSKSSKLGPDIFWWDHLSFDFDNFDNDDNLSRTTSNQFPNSIDNEINHQRKSSNINDDIESVIPFSQIDPQAEIIFICLSMLKSKENVLLELEESEIKEYLNQTSPFLTKKLKHKHKHRLKHLQNNRNLSRTSLNGEHPLEKVKTHTKSNEHLTINTRKYFKSKPIPMNIIDKTFTDIDDVINDAGELWRTWLLNEMNEDES
ncbi:Oca5p ASCRUDRAFT_33848, partial [Ascoidea rubescens DSM 1968]